MALPMRVRSRAWNAAVGAEDLAIGRRGWLEDGRVGATLFDGALFARWQVGVGTDGAFEVDAKAAA